MDIVVAFYKVNGRFQPWLAWNTWSLLSSFVIH